MPPWEQLKWACDKNLAGRRAREAGVGTPRTYDRPALEDTPRGRFLTSAVDGIIGDRLARERPRLAVPLAVRRDGRDVPTDRAALAEAFPTAAGRVAVLLHGLSENEAAFDRHRDQVGTTYAETSIPNMRSLRKKVQNWRC